MRESAKGSVIAGILCVFAGTAQAGVADVCRALTDDRIYDEERVQSTTRDFRLVERTFCRTDDLTFSSAKQIDADLGIDLLDILSGTVGGTVNEENFERKRTAFCDQLGATDTSAQAVDVRVRRVSTALVNAFTRCVEVVHRSPGIFPYVTTHGYSTFSISFPFVPYPDGDEYRVDQIMMAPKALGNCQVKLPIETAQRDMSILCSKPAGEEVTVAISSKDGNMQPVTLPAQPNVANRIADVERWQEDVRARNALLPRGMIGYFDTNECPGGWRPYEQHRGRYVVGLPLGGSLGETVGSALSNAENRASGAHSHGHAIARYVNQGRGARTRFSDNGAALEPGKVEQRTDTGGLKRGTNAPFVQLLACVKE